MRACVLLVEDDASLQRFVTMALDEFDVELVCCEAVAGASSVLAQRAVDLVLTDLTLVDGSALSFAASTARSGRSRVAVFSAGVTEEIERQLLEAGVWRVLRKPVPLADLQACVAEGLAAGEIGDAAGDAPTTHSRRSSAADMAASADLYFGGNRALMNAYIQRCRPQFADDVASGDRAEQSADAAALRRLAHSLKTVLRLIGRPAEAAVAEAIDDAVQCGDMPAARDGWQTLRRFLLQAASGQD